MVTTHYMHTSYHLENYLALNTEPFRRVSQNLNTRQSPDLIHPPLLVRITSTTLLIVSRMPKTNQNKLSPKSFDGCLTCRVKKIRCDMGKPACQNCIDKNIKCGGFDINLRWSNPLTFDFKHRPLALEFDRSMVTKEGKKILHRRRPVPLVNWNKMPIKLADLEKACLSLDKYEENEFGQRVELPSDGEIMGMLTVFKACPNTQESHSQNCNFNDLTWNNPGMYTPSPKNTEPITPSTDFQHSISSNPWIRGEEDIFTGDNLYSFLGINNYAPSKIMKGESCQRTCEHHLPDEMFFEGNEIHSQFEFNTSYLFSDSMSSDLGSHGESQSTYSLVNGDEADGFGDFFDFNL